VLSDHTVSILIFAGIDVIMALSFYLPASAGQLSAGQGGFMALGAYASAYLTVHHGAPFPLALAAGALVGGLVGLAVGFPALRLRGLYLVLVTFGFGEMVRVLFLNAPAFGGPAGFPSGREVTTFAVGDTATYLRGNHIVKFGGEVRRIHDHLAQKGRRLWIWGDRLLDGKTTGLGMWEASYSDSWRAIDLIPKDVTICDWHYERPDQSAVYFAMKGFQVVTCAYRRPKVAISQVKDMTRFRMTATPEMKERFQGVMQTVWSDAGGFLEREYQGKADGKNSANNSWTCFQAMFDEILKTKQAD